MLRLKESEMKKTVEMELMTIKAERETCAAKVWDAELKHKELERLKIALERKAETEIEDFKNIYEWEWEAEKRHFETRKR